MEPGLAETLLVLIVLCLVLGICAFVADLLKPKDENIADAQTTSERGLW